MLACVEGPEEVVEDELTVVVVLGATLEKIEVEVELVLLLTVLVNVAAYSRRACPSFDVMIKFPPDTCSIVADIDTLHVAGNEEIQLSVEKSSPTAGITLVVVGLFWSAVAATK
jgi:hypothetical protein